MQRPSWDLSALWYELHKLDQEWCQAGNKLVMLQREAQRRMRHIRARTVEEAQDDFFFAERALETHVALCIGGGKADGTEEQHKNAGTHCGMGFTNLALNTIRTKSIAAARFLLFVGAQTPMPAELWARVLPFSLPISTVNSALGSCSFPSPTARAAKPLCVMFAVAKTETGAALRLPDVADLDEFPGGASE
jgi:hypothetical protein